MQNIIDAYKAAGFEIDENRVSFKNKIGVSIIEFLDAKDAETKTTIRRGKTFVHRKFDESHCIVHRCLSEKNINFATIEPLSRF